MTDWNGQESNRSVTVPAGFVIEYEAQPKRLYRIDGEQVQSVTEILRCLDKPALPWWGMKVGVQGVQELHRRGLLQHDLTQYPVEGIIALLTTNQLTVNHIRDAGGTRGQSVHDALEQWAVDGTIPNPVDYPQEEQGYVCALVAFLHDVPTLTPDGIEIMVGSKEHGYAGRYDLRAHTTEEHMVVVKTYPKAASKVTKIPAGSGIWDLKTSAGVYGEHVLQLEGYEGASVEDGYDPTDFRVVIHVQKDGRYEVRRSKSTHADFLAIKACSEAIHRAEEGIKVKK